MSTDGLIDRDATAKKLVELLELMLKKEDPAAVRHISGQVSGLRQALAFADLDFRISIEIGQQRHASDGPPRVLREVKGPLY